MNLMALVLVLAEGQYVSADDEYSHRNIRQNVQNNGMKNRKAPGPLIQLKLEPNTSKRSQGKLKEEHDRGAPTFLSRLTMSSLGPEDAHHHLEWHVGERRRKPCAPLLRCPPYCVILLPQPQFWSISEIRLFWTGFLILRVSATTPKERETTLTCPPSRWSCCVTFVESLFLHAENKQCARLLQDVCVYVWVKLFLSDPSPIIGYACH